MTNKLDLIAAKGSKFSNSCFSFVFDIYNRGTESTPLSALSVAAFGWIGQRLTGSPDWGIVSAGKLTQHTIQGSFNGQNGVQVLNQFNTTYRVYHSTVDTTKTSPILTLNIPVGGAAITPPAVSTISADYFEFTLADTPPTLGYSVSWFLPSYSSDPFNGSVSELLNPVITYSKLSLPSVTNGYCDTQINVSWPNSTQVIPVGYKVENVEIYVNVDSIDDPNNWRTKLPDSKASTSTVILYQGGFNVSEYVDANTVDPNTGTSPDNNNTLYYNATYSVYVDSNSQNPIATTAADKDFLFTSTTRKSLVKFNTNYIPSDKSVKKSILRLCANGIYSGQVSVSRVTEAWNESEATTSYRKAGIPWSSNGVAKTSTITSYVKTTSSDFFIDLDVTSIVEAWRTGTSNFGFVIESDTDMRFSSTRGVSASDSDLPHSSPYLLVLSDTVTDTNTPKIGITSPADSYLFKNSDTFSLAATADFGITNLSAYKIENNITSFLGLMTNGGSWTYTSAASAVVQNSALIYVGGTSGTETYYSKTISVLMNGLPSLYLPSSSIVTTASSYTLSAYVTDKEGFITGNNVTILSGSGSVVTTAVSNSSGLITLTFTTPGTYSLSAKIFETNPLMNGEFSIVPFTFTFVKVAATLSIPYSNATKGGVIIVPNTKVVPSTFDYTSSVGVTGSSYSVQYLSLKNGIYTPLTYTGSKITIDEQGFATVVMRVVTSIGNYDVTVPVYVRKSQLTITAIADSSCAPVKTIEGKLVDPDLTSSGIDNSILVGLYRNNLLIDNVSLSSDGSFSQDMSMLDPGTGIIVGKVLDGYGTMTTSAAANIGTIYDPTMPFNMTITGASINYHSGNLFGTSSLSSVRVSADNISDAKSYSFVFTTSAGAQTILTAASNYVDYGIPSNELVDINVACYTNGGCTFTTSATLFHNFLPVITLYTPNYPRCYCSSQTLEITASVIDVGKYNSKFAEHGVTYSQNLSAGFNGVTYTSAIQSNGHYDVSFSTTALVGMTSAFVKISDVFNSTTYKTVSFKNVSQTPVIDLVSPVTTINYKETDDIHFSVSVQSGTISNVKYYIDGILKATSTTGPNFEYVWTGDKPTKVYTVSAIGTSDVGCLSNIVIKDIVISDKPYVKILGTYKEDTIPNFVAPNSLLTVEAKVSSPLPITSVVLQYVNLWGDTNINYINPMTYDSSRDIWVGSFNTSASFFANVFASAFDSNNTWGYDIVTFKTVDSMNATAYINGSPTSTSAYLTDTVPVNIFYSAGTSRNVVKTDIYSNDVIVYTNTTNTAVPGNETIYVPAYIIGRGDNTVYAIAYDDFGLSAKTNSIILTTYVQNPDSKPIIRLVSNNPENKVSTSSITATFEVYDLTNGIIQNSISATLNGSIVNSTVNSHNGILSYYVTTVINKTGYVTISALNRIGVSAEYRFNNYVIGCSTGRQINLTNYLPSYLQEDIDGSDSETKKFLGVFESTLNTLYTNLDDGCSLSTLEKVSRLQKLHDIDTIDSQYISNYANLLGYHSGPNASEIGSFGYFDDPDQYSDSIEEYKNKALRFVVRNLPNWYSIKTTRNSMKIMLLSYGIIGDMIEYYTTDYDTDWIQNRLDGNNFVEVDMPEDAYPTPHMAIGVDLTRTNSDNVYGDSLKNVMDAMESIRPANVVINGITGIIGDVSLPSFNIQMRHENKATIYVGPSTLRNR